MIRIYDYSNLFPVKNNMYEWKFMIRNWIRWVRKRCLPSKLTIFRKLRQDFNFSLEFCGSWDLNVVLPSSQYKALIFFFTILGMIPWASFFAFNSNFNLILNVSFRRKIHFKNCKISDVRQHRLVTDALAFESADFKELSWQNLSVYSVSQTQNSVLSVTGKRPAGESHK